MNVATEPVQSTGPQFVSHGIPTIETLDENAGIWIPATRIIRIPNITHVSPSRHDLGKGDEVGYSVEECIKENYKTDFEIWNKNSKLQSKRENIETS